MSSGATFIRKLFENMDSCMLAARMKAAAGLFPQLGSAQRFVQRQNVVSRRKLGNLSVFYAKSLVSQRRCSTLAASADSYQETQASSIDVNSSEGLVLTSVPVQEEAALVTETKVRKRKVRSSATKKDFGSSEVEVTLEAAAVVEEVVVSSSGAGITTSTRTTTSGTGAESLTKLEEQNVTFIVFDIETTGFRPAEDRIIEFAARDLAGGENSTVCALVNPGRQVPYFISAITGITNAMVNRPDIPSWKEVAPLIVRFVESRRQGNGPVVLVAHNGKRFDVPFLLKEFLDSSIEIPKDWRFLDSMPLAREAKKKCGYDWPSVKLGDIHKAYGLKKSGRAHRAMADVHMLAPVLGLMIWDLKMQLAEILERSFTADDIVTGSKLFQSQAEGAEDADEEILAKEEGFDVPWEGSIEQVTSHLEASEEEEVTLDTIGQECEEENLLPELELSSSIDTSSVDIEQLDPVLKRYVGMKRSMPDFVHLLLAGDQYEAFFEDAETLSRVCKTRLIFTDDGKIEVPVVRLSGAKANSVVKQLLSKGLNVVKQNQIGEGGVSAILTPGMLFDDGLSEETANNYLAAVVASLSSENWGLAFCDVSSGNFFATQGDTLESMKQAITCIEPAEVILSLKNPAVSLPSSGLGITRLCADCEFSPLTSESDLLLAAGSEVLNSLRNWAAADRASGALLRYIRKTQDISVKDLPFRRLCLYSVDQHLQMDSGVRSYLQLLRGMSEGGEGSLVWAMDSTRTAMGSRMLKRWISQPLTTIEDILTRQETVQALSENGSLRAMLRFHLSGLSDIGRLAGNIVRKQPVAWEDLLALADSLFLLRELSSLLERLPDNQYFSPVRRPPSVLTELAEEIQGMLSAGSSAKELVRDGIDGVLDTLRAEARDCRKFLEDFMQAQSQVPNANTSDANNEILEYEKRKMQATNRSSEREQQLLEVCKNRIVDLLDVLQATNESLAALDVLSTLAEVAATRDYCRPELIPDGAELSVVEGRHAIREVMEEVIPNSCYLGHLTSPLEGRPKPNVLILNGSPGSGKSTYLQQLGLIQVLAQCGSFVPAKQARLPVADAVYFIGPDTEPSAVAAVLRKANSRSLVLLDEFQATADCQEAEKAITKAIVEYLAKEAKTKAIFGTRDQSLRFQQDEIPYIASFHISSKEHILTPGTWYGVDGLELAKRVGFPDWVCTRAAELVDSGKEPTRSSRTTGISSSMQDASNTGPRLWHKIIDLTTPTSETGKQQAATSEPCEDLDALWKQVWALLQNTPATLALAQQKGSLRSVCRGSEQAVVTIGTAPLFVKKFTQHEHAAALEAAFGSILNRPVKLRVELDR